ncbi:hypothetical protein DTO96_102318 [Ephemeroptericola cinctiostellae]|uniref:Uncharacterized protein n=1 Tax=Ephemeroptericola cinctiostellae TaxID=2268024 RepID=A0A345DDX5_9BURK|nr:hypothetical protein [Ephemeroptericola cinctiostellae]AXF86563.1 hypothetical protein DTO96_102318 [Ephemeroptericola cinctiostellae]
MACFGSAAAIGQIGHSLAEFTQMTEWIPSVTSTAMNKAGLAATALVADGVQAGNQYYKDGKLSDVTIANLIVDMAGIAAAGIGFAALNNLK